MASELPFAIDTFLGAVSWVRAETYAIEVHRVAAAKIVNLGCDLLVSGQYGPAVKTLREGIALLSQPSVEIHVGDSGDDEQVARLEEAYLRAAEECLSKVAKAEARVMNSQGGEKQEGTTMGVATCSSPSGRGAGATLLVYRMPFRLPHPAVAATGGLSSIVNLEEASAVALFNLALAHHLAAHAQAPSFSQYSRQLSDKALALYEMTEAVLLPMQQEDPLTWQRQRLLSAAALNNMGAILFENGEHRRSRENFKMLNSVWAPVAKEDDASDVFDFNALMVDQMNGAPAA